MAILVMEGFEAGSVDVCDSYYSNPAVSDAQARTGTYSLLCGSGDHVLFDLGSGKTEIYLGVGVYITGGQFWYSLLELIDSGGTSQASFAVHDTSQTLEAYRGNEDGTRIATGGFVPLNHWKYIEIHLVIHDTSGVCTVKLDGTQIINFTGDTSNGGTADIKVIRLGTNTGATTAYADVYFDDLVVNDTTGSYNNSWTGRGGIELLSPNGAGNSTDLTASAGSNYECVDEQPPDDDTTYVYGSTPDDHDGYTLTNTTQTGTVEAIKWFARAKTTAAGSDAIKRHLRIGTTDYNGASDLNLTTDYAYYKEILEENPADSAAFETADLDAMEAGVVVR